MSRADDIVTDRLVLRLMGKNAVAAVLAGDLVEASALLGAHVPPELLERPRGMEYGMLRFEEDPLYAPWGPRAILLRGGMIGHFRFHSRPDPEDLHPYARNAVEFGYTVFPGHRGHGYATEAAAGVMGWARAAEGVANFVLTISPDNAPSLALAARLGFVRVGEQMDEEDGLELVFLRTGA